MVKKKGKSMIEQKKKVEQKKKGESSDLETSTVRGRLMKVEQK